MVFTVPMQQRASRRAVLAGLAGTAAGVALAGCWPGSGRPTVHPAPHPLTPVLAGTRALADRYRATIAGYPDLSGRLDALLADHQTHIEALRTAMGTPAASAS